MADVCGNVQRVVSKPAGRGTAYNIQMDDGQWYGHGFQQPNFGQGAEISFDVTYNGQYANIVVESVEVINAGQPQQQQRGGYQGGQGRSNGGGNNRRPNNGGGSRAQAAGGMSKDQYWENKEKRDLRVQRQIQHQASRNAAIEVVKMAFEQGAVSLPAKKDAKLDALLALVAEVTDQFNEDTTNVGQAKQQQHRPTPQQQQQEQQDEEFGDDIPF